MKKLSYLNDRGGILRGYFPDLQEEYSQLLSQMRKDGITSGELFREVKQAKEWLETGYDPALTRAATRIDAFLVEPHYMQEFVSYINGNIQEDVILEDFKDCMTEEEILYEERRLAKVRKDVNDAMYGLTENEKAVFVAIKSDLMTFRAVAEVFGVSKSAIQSRYNAAVEKIQRNIEHGSQTSLFTD